jgi:glucose dehydrogenase
MIKSRLIRHHRGLPGSVWTKATAARLEAIHETIVSVGRTFRVPSIMLALALAAAAVPHGSALAQAADAQWTTPAGTVQGTRFSDLAQINTTNVGQLQEEFHFTTGVQTGHEGARW